VGLVRDARINYLKDPPPPLVIRPIAQEPGEFLYGIEARVRGPASQVMPAIREALRSVDKHLPVQEFATLGEYLRRGLQSQQFVSELVGLFSGLALVLAAIGLYGVMAYSVARRTNEIGIRLALGAAPGQVRWLVLGDTLRLVVGGLVIGIILLIPSLGLVRSLVYGFSPRDPATLGVAVLILLAAGVLAGTVPAWRAARVDPVTALRAD
jgi:putative ABC transport system permease protein